MYGEENVRLKHMPKLVHEICTAMSIVFHFRNDPSSLAAELLSYHAADDELIVAVKVYNTNYLHCTSEL